MTQDGKLHPHDCVALANISSQAGYKVIVAIAEREIENLQRDAVNVDPAKRDEVLAAQAVAHAAAKFWKAVQESCNEAIKQAGMRPELPLSKEQMKVAADAELVDPTDRKGLRILEAS